MESLLDVGLANALTVAVIAPIAALAGRVIKRPAWVHSLWIIVLFMLIAPPVARVPILPARAVAARAEPPTPTEARPAPDVLADLPDEGPAPALPAPIPAAPLPRRSPAPPSSTSWRPIAGSAWLAGSSAWLMLAAWRIVRFARAVRRAEGASDELQGRVDRLSGQIGLVRPPVAILAPGRLAPMVWALGGRARLIVPEALWARLDEEQRAALLVHELAHLRRRDHWVRLLEMIATGLYWWHPALWLARRELHRCEEECCDLWVVWALPEARKPYATALVEAVDFLSEARPRRLPVGASGMGQIEDLSRRIGMIMRGDTPRGLSRTGLFAAAAAALLLLPLRPSLARQAPKGEDETPKTRPIVTRVEPTTTQVDPTVTKAPETATPRAAELDQIGQDLGVDFSPETLAENLKTAIAVEARTKKLFESGAVTEAEMAKAQGAVLALKAQILDHQRLKAGARQRAIEEVEVLRSQVKTREAYVRKAEAQLRLAQTELQRIARLEEVGPKGFISKGEKERAAGEVAIAEAMVAEARAETDEVRVKLNHATARVGGQSPKTTTMRTNPPPPIQADPATRRIDELESKLDRVLKDMESLRKDQSPKLPPKGRPVQRPALRPKTNQALLDLLKRMEDKTLSNEEVTRRIYAILFDREPKPRELEATVNTLALSSARRDALPQIVRYIAPLWSEDTTEEFLQQGLANRSPEDAAEITYRAILDRAPTPAEVERFASALPFSTDRTETLRQLVGDVIKLRKEVLKSEFPPHELPPIRQ